MNFVHPFFKNKINTDSKKVKALFKELNHVYSQLPVTKCIHCPGKSGVEADCCKVFSPPMLLIEFLNIITEVETWSKNKQDQLLYDCFESFVNPDYSKPCIMLNNVLCSVYKHRPLSCYLFGTYSDEEYLERSKNVQIELDLEPSQIPFFEQCKNLEPIKGHCPVSKIKSDTLFKKIHKLDIELFEDKKLGEQIVMSSATYMTVDAHYLCIKTGDANLELLATLKSQLRILKNKINSDKSNVSNQLEFSKKESQVKDFLSELRKSIISLD